MNLYFLDANDKQHLVARNVSEEDAIPKMLIDLYNRYPDFKNYYQRTWWDNFHRYWIDYGSHTEFYILQEEKYALNVVDDVEIRDGKKELNVVKAAAVQDGKNVEQPACNRYNRDYCDI